MALGFLVRWSKEDDMYIATCDLFPSLSNLDRDPNEALRGLKDLILDVLVDLWEEREAIEKAHLSFPTEPTLLVAHSW